MTLTEFLLARIAEDEREANVMMERYENGGDVSSRRWRRVLAECEAKRRIVELHHAAHYCADGTLQAPVGPDYFAGGDDRWRLCPTVAALAMPYADHPDYDEAWRP